MPDVIRLDLGAGDKREPGWIHVDQTTWSENVAPPDVIADISKPLPFPDNYADEIRAIHVIEHFYRWETQDILKEWVRVLKPGGMLALECPNLESCIANIIKDPTNLRLGILGLYGDPDYRSVVMTHKWAFSPKELAALMHLAGLTDLVCKSPQFHYSARDMRFTGIKSNA